MKIAIIHNQLRSSGGMESYMLALINGFLAAGDEVHIFTYDVDKKLATRLNCTLHRLHLLFVPRRWKKYCFLFWQNRKFNRNAYDLSLALTRTGAAHVAVVGGVHPASVAMRGKNGHLLRRFHDWMEIRFERYMFALTPTILAHSKGIVGEITTYYPEVDAEKIVVRYPPVDTDFFVPVTGNALQKVRSKYHIDPNRMTLLFPSKGHRRKGLKELLAAFTILDHKKYELLVVGEKLRGFQNIPANVRYLGYIDNLSGLYGAVDYTVLPSWYEPFGLTVVESLHCGTPVLTSRQVGASEILSPAEGVILENITAEDIAESITQLKKNVVEPGFVQHHGLNISRHIAELKTLVCTQSGKKSRDA